MPRKKKNPYKDVDRFLNTKCNPSMMPAATWKDWLFTVMLETAVKGAVPLTFNYFGIDWRTHLADAMQFNGKMTCLRRTRKIHEDKFAKHFERVLDRLFYVDEESKVAHFTRLFSEIPLEEAKKTRELDEIYGTPLGSTSENAKLGLGWENYQNRRKPMKIVEE